MPDSCSSHAIKDHRWKLVEGRHHIENGWTYTIWNMFFFWVVNITGNFQDPILGTKTGSSPYSSEAELAKPPGLNALWWVWCFSILFSQVTWKNQIQTFKRSEFLKIVSCQQEVQQEVHQEVEEAVQQIKQQQVQYNNKCNNNGFKLDMFVLSLFIFLPAWTLPWKVVGISESPPIIGNTRIDLVP